MQKMNVWYLSAHDQPKGQSSRTYDFSTELVKLGHKVTMFTNSYCHWTHEERLGPHEKWRIEEINGIRVVWLRTIHYTGNGVGRGMNMIWNACRSIQVARILSDTPDVVIGPSVPLGTGLAASIIAGMKGASFVFEVRDVWPIALINDGGMSKRNPVFYVFRFIEKYLYRRAHRISATMPFLFDHVSKSGSDPGKVTWIPNGVNFERFNGYEPYDGSGILPLTAMYVGGFGVAHDVITMVKAAKILQAEGNNKYKFVIIGDGVKRADCEREARMNQLMNIEFRDSIPKADIPRTQMDSDILVACILDSDIYRFGLNLNKIFDYFASGRPVIFSGKAPNDPIAESGAGFSIPPENPEAMVCALKEYLEMSPADRIAMGKRGRCWVEKEFDMHLLGLRMEKLLFQAIKDKGQKHAT
jgi:glycosyltransferase involved in cell wall biosynthesis